MPHKFTPEYPPEFRSEAVRLVRDGGRSSAAAMDLGVSAESLRHRVKQDALDSGQRKDGLTSDERKELVRLPRENRDLREDREILKEAAAFFSWIELRCAHDVLGIRKSRARRASAANAATV